MIPHVLSNGVRSCVEAGSVKMLANSCCSSPKSESSLCRSFQRWQPGSRSKLSGTQAALGSENSCPGRVEVRQVAAREGLVIENEKVVAINALRDSEIILVVRAKWLFGWHLFRGVARVLQESA